MNSQPLQYMQNVIYLEDTDFDGNKLKSNVGNGLPCVVLLQGNYCGHCKNVKPMYEQLAQQIRNNCVLTTIQQDHPDTSVKNAYTIMSKIIPIDGVPKFVGFDKDGNYKSVFQGERTPEIC